MSESFQTHLLVFLRLQQFSAFNPERSESDQDSQWGGSPLTEAASPQLLDPSEAAEASCAYRLYPDSGSLCYGLGLLEEDLAHAQTRPLATACDRVRCQSGRYFLGAPQSGREVWWDATRSVLALPKPSADNNEGYEITSYHAAFHGEAFGLTPQPSVSGNSSGLAAPNPPLVAAFQNVITGHAKLFMPSLASVSIATICSKKKLKAKSFHNAQPHDTRFPMQIQGRRLFFPIKYTRGKCWQEVKGSFCTTKSCFSLSPDF